MKLSARRNKTLFVAFLYFAYKKKRICEPQLPVCVWLCAAVLQAHLLCVAA